MRHRSTVGGALEMFSSPLPFFTGVAHLILIGVRLRWQCFLWSLMSLMCPGVRSGPDFVLPLHLANRSYCLRVRCVVATVCRRYTVIYIVLWWCCFSSVYSWLLSSFSALLVLSQWSNSKPWQIWGNYLALANASTPFLDHLSSIYTQFISAHLRLHHHPWCHSGLKPHFK